MGEQKNVALAFEKHLAPLTKPPAPVGQVPPAYVPSWGQASRPAPALSSAQTAESSVESRLDVAVVFTSPASTMAALREASGLASRLNASISVLVPQVVPYPAPLESPPVLLDFSEQWFREIAAQSPVETSVQIYLCRDRADTLRAVLAPRSLVVIGGRKRWWATPEKILARKLRRAGHEVIFTEAE